MTKTENTDKKILFIISMFLFTANIKRKKIRKRREKKFVKKERKYFLSRRKVRKKPILK